jgi:hypothetical protein
LRCTAQEAELCCARITISSVVVPMISFARFKETHKILPIESWEQKVNHISTCWN